MTSDGGRAGRNAEYLETVDNNGQGYMQALVH